MNTNNPVPAEETAPAAAAKKKKSGKRAALGATLLVSSGLALVGFAVGSGVAQAAPVAPAPQHFCEFWEWDWDYCHFDYDYEHHDH